MTVLEEWRKKKSYKHTMPLFRVYKSKATGRRDILLSKRIGKEKTLNLLPDRGFNQFEVCNYKPEINRNYLYLTSSLPKLDLSTPEFAKRLVKEVENYLISLWDSNKFHLVLCSAGMDSRIISWVLAELRDKQGKDWVGKIHFRCHEPEGSLFKTIMKRQGWDASQYSVYNDGQFNKPDYYAKMGDFDSDANGYVAPMSEFWDDIIKKEDEKNTVLVTGSCGGEQFSYPLFRHWKFTDNRYADLVNNTRGIMLTVHRATWKWRDILAPFLSYNFLDMAFRVPRKLFKWVEMPCVSITRTFRDWQKRDFMRSAMVKVFKDDIPLYVGHGYNLKVSPGRAEYMKQKFLGSKLYRDYKHLSWVKDAKPWLLYRNYRMEDVNKVISSSGAKLYGLATCYERSDR